jgi:hypothetical protein
LLDHQRSRQLAHALRTSDLQFEGPQWEKSHEAEQPSLFGGEDLDLVTAKNDAIARHLADQSARGS